MGKPENVLNGLKISFDPLAAMEGEKTALCLSQSLQIQEVGIPERPRATANFTCIPLNMGCFDGSSVLQELSKRAGHGIHKDKHHPSLTAFGPLRHNTAHQRGDQREGHRWGHPPHGFVLCREVLCCGAEEEAGNT